MPSFAEKTLLLYKDDPRYLVMCNAAHSFTTKELTWDAVVRHIAQGIKSHDRV